MTAVTAGLGVILEEDPRVGLSGVRSGRPVSSQPWRLHSSAFPPSATGSCSLRCTAERNGQSLLHVCIHKPAHKSPQQQPRERTGACDNNYLSFPARTLFPKGHFPHSYIPIQSSGLYSVLLSASQGGTGFPLSAADPARCSGKP